MQYLKEKLEKDILLIDELTGIFNRRFFERILPYLLKNVKRCTFAIFDIDDFKHVNDNYGHLTGDRILKKVGESLKSLFAEKNEFPIRYAGDEFIILILETERDKSLEKIREMFEKIHNTEIEEHGRKIKVSISCGISFFPEDGLSHEELLSKADEGLYYVKRRGKNNFIVYRDVLKIIEKEKILKNPLTPKEFFNYEEEKGIINTGIERGKGVFIITGPSGTGKTRFLKFIERECKKRDFFTIMCFTTPNDKNLPFNSILRGINIWLDNERIDILKEKGMEKYLEYFLIKKGEHKEEINVEEIFDFLERFFSEFKVCLLIDDAENLDRYSVEFIEIGKVKSLFALSVQDLKSLNPALIEESLLISFSPLPSNLIEEYLKATLQDFEYPNEFIKWIAELSEGNPFLIEEILRYLLEKDYVIFSDKTFNLFQPEIILSKKLSIVEIIKERLKNLDKESRIFLYSLSIGEKYFDLQTASEYSGINQGRTMEIVEKLIEKHFLSRVSEDIYCFRNLLIKNMIYNGMEESIKKKLHQRLAKTLETSKRIPYFLTSMERAKHYRIAGEIQKAREIVERINSFLEKLQTLPDLKRLKILKKKKRLQTELKFTPLTKENFTSVDFFLRKLYGAMEGVKIYPPSSSVVLQRIRETFEILKKILLVQESLIMGIHSGKLIINESEIPENKTYIKKIKEFMEESRLESLIFTQEINEEDFRKFILLTKEIKEILTRGISLEETIDNMNLKGIFANERVYVAIGGEYGEIGEWEMMDVKELETFMEPGIPPAKGQRETEKEEEMEYDLDLLLNNEEKLKKFTGKLFLELYSQIFNKQKKSLEVLEKIYQKASSEIKTYIAEEITGFYFQKATAEIKDILKDKIWMYIGNLIEKDVEKFTSLIEKDKKFMENNLWKLIKMVEDIQNAENREKLKAFLKKKGKENLENLIKKCKKEDVDNPIFQKIIEERIEETKGSLLNLILEKSDKGISRKILDLLIRKKTEIILKALDDFIKREENEKIRDILEILEEIPDKRFLPFLMKIIKKRNKFEKEFPYNIQIKAIDIMKKLNLKDNLNELIEIAKKESLFSFKKNKETFLRVELIKLLFDYRKEEVVLNFLRSMEKEKEPSIRVMVKKMIESLNYGREE